MVDNPSTDFTIGPGMAYKLCSEWYSLISGRLNADEKKFIVHGSWISSGIIYSEDTNELQGCISVEFAGICGRE